MPSRAVGIIKRIYASELVPRRRVGFARIWGERRLKAANRQSRGHIQKERATLLTRSRILIIACACVGFGVLFLSAYYYNLLTRYEQDVFMEQAKIDSLLQRRRNISTNLARTVQDYAIHERGVFRNVSEQRSAAQGVPKATNSVAFPEGPVEGTGWLSKVMSALGNSAGLLPDPHLAGVLAVAEQYPDLKLSENFQRFMNALVEMEKELSACRMTYSEVVNRYTTQLKTFPCNLFAKLYGFDTMPYYTADSEARRFRPIEY